MPRLPLWSVLLVATSCGQTLRDEDGGPGAGSDSQGAEARVPVEDGVHELGGAAPFSVAVVGYDQADSYAYLGGMGTSLINPEPEG